MNALPNLRSVPHRANPSIPFDPFADAAPSSLYDQIVRSIGAHAAEKLIADFGGRRLYILIAPGPDDQVTKSIGLIAALAMARSFGGDRLMIPSTNDHARRRARIIAMRADHISIPRIARQLRCTERYVYKVLALERITSKPAPVAEHFKRGIISRRP
jgi:Homeodomain-like domain-containing protein